MTPAMQQYIETKSQYPDHLVLFRMGDFYETFYEDAKTASKILGITLTARDRERKVPMAGIPFHALDNYLSKLIDANQKVVLVEQLEDPKQAKGIVKRGIVKIFTPGTTPTNKDLKKSIFLVALDKNDKSFFITFIDLNDGIIRHLELSNLKDFYNNIQILEPKEIIIPSELEDDNDLKNIREKLKTALINFVHNSFFQDLNITENDLNKSLISKAKKLDAKSIYGILNYLAETQRTNLGHISDIQKHSIKNYVKLDYNVVRNLELLDGQRPDATPLLNILDRCSTLAGSRLLRQWLVTPLTDLDAIKERQKYVNSFKELGLEFIVNLQDSLKEIHDLNRITSKMGLNSANARDLRNLVESIKVIFSTISGLKKTSSISPELEELCNQILKEVKTSQNILSEINSTLVEMPPLTVREGGMIKTDLTQELAELYDLKNGGKEWLKNFEIDEIKRTGISSLKVRFNKVFGYYIEISKGNVSKAPENYIRKQTLVNAERFITPELKEYEAKALGAEDQICKLEYEIFSKLLENSKSIISNIQKINELISAIDIYSSFASLAIEEDWIMPTVNDSLEITIENGRHPVVESILKNSGKLFVKNSYHSDRNCTLQIITGPNMGGKSTFLRQIVIIVLLAQIGSFVPASKAEIGIVDQIFTRVGASDNLSAGESTFMVEMLEAAEIIKNATPKSLIILDEVGRGTSTFDGMSLAWAICEYLAEVGSRTLFATHYHEITELANKYPNVKNLAVKVIDHNGEIVFMHQIYPGKADKSYGIHVAKLAGMPKSVIKKSEQVLKLLEKEKNKLQAKPQDLFQINEEEEIVDKTAEIIDELNKTEIQYLSPVEALQLLDRWKKMMK